MLLKQHTEFGYKLLKHSSRPLIKTVALLARDHHEHWNGQGYPRGLVGEEIHIHCRITALADAYDAMRSKRSCTDELPVESAIEAILCEKGQQFEPKLVEILQANIDKIEQVLLNNPDPE